MGRAAVWLRQDVPPSVLQEMKPPFNGSATQAATVDGSPGSRAKNCASGLSGLGRARSRSRPNRPERRRSAACAVGRHAEADWSLSARIAGQLEDRSRSHVPVDRAAPTDPMALSGHGAPAAEPDANAGTKMSGPPVVAASEALLPACSPIRVASPIIEGLAETTGDAGPTDGRPLGDAGAADGSSVGTASSRASGSRRPRAWTPRRPRRLPPPGRRPLAVPTTSWRARVAGERSARLPGTREGRPARRDAGAEANHSRRRRSDRSSLMGSPRAGRWVRASIAWHACRSAAAT